METMTDWHPVTNAAGDVLGWMAEPDPDEPLDGEYFTVDRLPHVRRRAAVLDQAAALFADSAFDPRETWDCALATGLTDADLDAAAHVAVVLREVELDSPRD
jgi:hypothetical protein